MRLTVSAVGNIIVQELTAVAERISADIDAATARRSFFDAKLAVFATLAHAWSQQNSGIDARAAASHYIELGILDAQSAKGILSGSKLYANIANLHAEIEPGDLSTLYQQVLQSDLGRQDGQYRLMSSKTSRDSSGAYYTPRELAQEITRHSVDMFIHEHTGISHYSTKTVSSTEREAVDSLLASARIADLSCGAGDFLLAALDYARDYSGVADLLVKNLWGADVDPIALIITAAEIEYRTGGAAPHLVLGNPLLGGSGSASLGRKAELFSAGRIYAPGMSICPKSTYPDGGFDVILGNPPWEKIRFEERKTRELLGQDERTSALTNDLIKDYTDAKSLIFENRLLRHAPRGEANTYALFPLLGTSLLAPKGVMALVLKSAIATSPVNSPLFSWLRNEGGLREIHLFENTSRIFSIDSREKFCVGFFKNASSKTLVVSVGNTTVSPFVSAPTVTVTDKDLWAMYPSTGTLPNVKTIANFTDLQALCARLPRFADQYSEAKFGRIVHLTSHAKSISKTPETDSLPILEGKFIGPYTLRASTFQGITEVKRYKSKAHARRTSFAERHQSKTEPRYYISARRWQELAKGFTLPYMLCWRSLTSATNARTTIAAIAPFGPALQSVQFLQLSDKRVLTYLLGLFNSMAFDHLVRQMIPGIDLTQSVIRQVPVPDARTLRREIHFAESSARLDELIITRVERLLRHDPDCVAFLDGPQAPVQPLSEIEHLGLISEIDELFFMAYGLNTAEIEHARADFNSRD